MMLVSSFVPRTVQSIVAKSLASPSVASGEQSGSYTLSVDTFTPSATALRSGGVEEPTLLSLYTVLEKAIMLFFNSSRSVMTEEQLLISEEAFFNSILPLEGVKEALSSIYKSISSIEIQSNCSTPIKVLIAFVKNKPATSNTTKIEQRELLQALYTFKAITKKAFLRIKYKRSARWEKVTDYNILPPPT